MNELIITLFLFEIFELFWQKGNTLYAYINSLLFYYKKSAILFFALHPSFYFILFCIVVLHLKSTLLIIIAMVKGVDIVFKASILNRIDNNLPLNTYEVLLAEDKPLPLALKISPLLIYVALFYFALAPSL